jgi:hypothetical protein
MRRGSFASLVVTASATLAAAAGAQGAGDTPIRIDYRAPPECPNEGAFLAELARRAQVPRFAEAGELARVITVVVESSPERSRARVELTDIDGQPVRREVEATTCTEVVSAIALVTALALEAQIAEEAAHERAQPKAPKPAPRKETPPAATAPAASTGAKSAPPEARSSWWSFGAAGGYATGMAPDGLFQLRAFGGLALQARWEVRFSAAYGAASAVRESANLTFSAAWARLEGCWLAVAIGARGSLGPCAGLEGGVLHASGVEGPRVAVAKSATEPWAAGVALGRIRLAEQVLFVEAQGELIAPLVRHEFVLEKPRAEVHEFPALAFGAALGVGVVLE